MRHQIIIVDHRPPNTAVLLQQHASSIYQSFSNAHKSSYLSIYRPTYLPIHLSIHHMVSASSDSLPILALTHQIIAQSQHHTVCFSWNRWSPITAQSFLLGVHLPGVSLHTSLSGTIGSCGRALGWCVFALDWWSKWTNEEEIWWQSEWLNGFVFVSMCRNLETGGRREISSLVIRLGMCGDRELGL